MNESNDNNESLPGVDSVLDLVKPTTENIADPAQAAESVTEAQTQRFGRTLPQNYGDKVVQSQDDAAPETDAAKPAFEIVPYQKPDGTQGQLELPTDPEERLKKIASLASGTDAYEAGRDIVREKAPQLSDEWRGLLKVQQDTLKTIQDNQQQQAQQDYDPLKGLNADQREYYDYLKEEKGDEREAALYLKKELTSNLMLFDAQQQAIEQKKDALRQKVQYRVKELRAIDKSLPNPARGNDENFQRSFNSGFGGFLIDQGFSEEQIFFSDNIDFETQYLVYQTKSGQSQKKLSTSEDTKKTDAKAEAVAKATISPDVAKSIKDVAGGNLSANIGNNEPLAKYKDAKSRSDIRKLDQQDGGKLGIAALEGFGISKFLTGK